MNEDLRLHREAEVLMGRADLARAQGRPQDAARFSREAAELESQVFDHLPPDRPKTRGIVAVSSVVLFREALDIDEAICHAERFLRLGSLSKAGRRDLEDMLVELRDESSRAVWGLERAFLKEIDLSPRRAAELGYIIATAYSRRGDDRQARKYAREAIRLLASVSMASEVEAAPIFHREYALVGMIEPNYISGTVESRLRQIAA
jgi:tetratricopeptide (TPR) repeat protein